MLLARAKYLFITCSEMHKSYMYLSKCFDKCIQVYNTTLIGVKNKTGTPHGSLTHSLSIPVKLRNNHVFLLI